MLKGLSVALMLASSSVSLASAPSNPANEVAVERFGIYVVADDLDRAAAFYQELFGKEPQVRNAGLVGFDVAGGLYAIVSRQTYAPNSRLGDNAVPYIKVTDIFGAFERVKKLAPSSLRTEKVVEEGPFKFFKFAIRMEI